MFHVSNKKSMQRGYSILAQFHDTDLFQQLQLHIFVNLKIVKYAAFLLPSNIMLILINIIKFKNTLSTHTLISLDLFSFPFIKNFLESRKKSANAKTCFTYITQRYNDFLICFFNTYTMVLLSLEMIQGNSTGSRLNLYNLLIFC